MTGQHSMIGFHSLQVCAMGRGPATRPADTLEASMMAGFDLSMNIESLFPFINAVTEKAEMFENPPYIRFRFDHTLCVLHPDKGFASPFDDNVDARDFMMRLMAFLNDIYYRKEEITPKYKLFSPADITRILKLLPRTNCNDCGFTTCMAFAAMLGRQQTIPARCPHISRPVQEKAVFPIMDKDGKLLSTLTLNVDNTQNINDLDSARQYIETLKNKIEQLSGLKKDLKDEANRQLQTPLSQREIDVLQLLALGSTNAEIGLLLYISPHTVKSHINHIFNKLGVNSRTQASVWATQHHFV